MQLIFTDSVWAVRGESMSSVGCPYDNACAGSFFSFLKNERIPLFVTFFAMALT